MFDLRRRQFIGLLCTAAAWPTAVRAQSGERMRRIGVLMSVADGPEGQARVRAFLKGLEQLGWIVVPVVKDGAHCRRFGGHG